MNRLINIVFRLFSIIIFCILLNACSSSLRNEESISIDETIVKDRFLFDGHYYIYFSKPYDAYNYVIVHDPDCDCPSRW